MFVFSWLPVKRILCLFQARSQHAIASMLGSTWEGFFCMPAQQRQLWSSMNPYQLMFFLKYCAEISVLLLSIVVIFVKLVNVFHTSRIWPAMLNVCCILRPAFGHVQSTNGTFFSFSKFKSDLLQVLYVGGHICRNELGILPDLLHCFGDLLSTWSHWIICQTFVICQSVNSCPWHDPLRKLLSTSSTSIWFIELQGIVLSISISTIYDIYAILRLRLQPA